jgi:hypothetical protein
MADITYWEKNFSGDIYNTNASYKVGINNADPILTLDVIGSIGLTDFIEFKKPSHDVVQLLSASGYGYDFKVYNKSEDKNRLVIDSNGKVGINTNSLVSTFSVVEESIGNAWPVATFTNLSPSGYGIEVTGGNNSNEIAIFKDYANEVRGTLSGDGHLWVDGSISSNNGTSVPGNYHIKMKNDRNRFAFLLFNEETGINNAGSDFSLKRYSDGGSELGTVISVIRATGLINLNGTVNISENLNVTQTITAGKFDLGIEGLNKPVGQDNKIIVVRNGDYVFEEASFVFAPDLSNYYNKVEIDNLFENYLPDTFTVALNDLTDVDVSGALVGDFLKKTGSGWESATIDLSNYYTKSESDARFITEAEALTMVTNYHNTHVYSLQQVTNVGATTTNDIEVFGTITSEVSVIGGVRLDVDAGTFNIRNSTHIGGLLSFDSIDLNLYDLNDVDPSVQFAINGSVLKKESGKWIAAPNEADNLDDYYTKVESDDRFVHVVGDTMTGGLIIDTNNNHLTLNSNNSSSIVSITNSGTELSKIGANGTNLTTTLYGGTHYVNRDGIGNVISLLPNGNVVLGDSNRSSTELGKLIITSRTPSLILDDLDNAGTGGTFRVVNSGGNTFFQFASDTTFSSPSTPISMDSTKPVLYYNTDAKLTTKNTGVVITGEVQSTTADVNGIKIYKSTDGHYIVDGNVSITGQYLEDWTGPGTGKRPGAWKLDELEDVQMGGTTTSSVTFPFLLGRTTPTGPYTMPIGVDDIIAMLDVVTNPIYQQHRDDTDIHITTTERVNWNLAYNNISHVKDWDLTYLTYDYTEIGLADVAEEGTAIGDNKDYMKYAFYWDGSTKWSLKTRFADDADHLGGKPADEYRYSRALGYTADNCDSIYHRSLYDLGTVSQAGADVPADGSWQVETVDASYIFNQNEADGPLKHKHQFATKWVDREDYFEMWARTHDGSVPEWLPWVQFFHSGNLPTPIDFYPELPQSAYDELQNELNWVTIGDPKYEIYIGEVTTAEWSINIGQRVVDNWYIYEATPDGMRRIAKGAMYLYDLFDVDFKKYGTGIDPDEGDVLIYQGDETWKPGKQLGAYIVQEVIIANAETEVIIPPDTDRLELEVRATASNNISIIVEHDREKPVVIDLINESGNTVSVYYTDDIDPNTKLLDMQPDAIIEVHPGIWELN